MPELYALPWYYKDLAGPVSFGEVWHSLLPLTASSSREFSSTNFAFGGQELTLRIGWEGGKFAEYPGTKPPLN